MNSAYTETILDWFEKISRIPRRSRHEKALSDWLLEWAREHSFATRRDDVLNTVIEVPATTGYETAPVVTIQGHMDMVCERAKGSNHDFSRDPIQLIREGDWLRANETTLGADNGISIAMAMTLATARDLPHPPLELLFTVDEETGLTGANAVGADFLNGKILLNVDSEDEGVFTVGCAGGRDTHITLPIETAKPPEGWQPCRIVVEGLKGGHSGVDIHEQRGNAVQTLARALRLVLDTSDACLVSLQGGTAHNAIPRDAEALLLLPPANLDDVRQAMERLDAALKSELTRIDPKVTVRFEEETVGAKADAFSAQCTATAVDLLLALPHGVEAFSLDIEGLVETSDNLAKVRTENGNLVVITSQRSSIKERLDLLTHRIEAVGRLAGADAGSDPGYPAWQADMYSPLLARCKRLYEQMFHKEPVVEIIHAGLECGIIGDKYPGMDMISFGPTIKEAHSPEEKLEIPSIGPVFQFLTALLKELKAP